MWNRFSGKSDESEDDLPLQNSWRKNGEQRHPANRSNSIASATTNKKSSSSADYRVPQGFNPTFRSRSSTTRGQHPGATLASGASSYATASGDNNGESHLPYGLARNVSLADQMPRSTSSRDHEQTREMRDKRPGKTERFHGRDQSAERRQKRDKRSKKDRASRRPEEELDKELGTSRGPDDFPDQVASSGFSQFPGQYDGAMPGSSGTAHDHLAMSSHVQDQFPGQFSIQSAAFYHPPLAASEGGPGLAAEYYGDAGQSVAEQPGNRVNTPSLIVGAEPHLQPALAVAAPPPEPSASGAVGAAASFFSGEFEEGEAVSTHGQQDSSTSAAGQIRPNSNHHSSSAPVISTIGGMSIGSAAGYLIDSQTSSHQQRPDHESSIEGAPSEYFSMATHQPPSKMQDSHYSSTSQPSKPGKQSSQLSSNPMYAAGLAGTVGLAAAAYEHNHHSSNQNLSSTSQHSTSSMAQRHRNRGPLSALLDFFKDPEGVAQFEEYSQIIGVCRHCFAPGSSSRDAPRKHFYGRRRSNERYGSTTRVDKDSRYYSSENESRRKNKSWLGPGLAGYGLAKVGESLFMEKDDFDDTYSAKTGRFSPDGKDRRARRRSRSKEHFEIGITGDNKSDSKGTRNDISNGTGTTTFSTRRYSRMGSGSKDRETGLTEPAIGATLGTPVVTSSSRRQSRSPRGASVKSKHMSQAPSPEIRQKTKKKKRDGGFFSFGNGSSSSSSEDLAYPGSQNKHRSSKGSTGRSKDDKKAEAALLGLGAAAAALALNDGRQARRKKGGKQHVRVKETKDRDGHGSAQTYRPKKPSGSADEELWESAAEDEYGSMDSDLAYGAPVRRDSRASLSSESSGTNKWVWRWASKKNRRASPPRRKSSDRSSFPAVVIAAGADATGAALASPDQRHGSAMNSTSSLPLQHVYPVPTSDPSRFDVGPEAPIASSNRPATSSRPEAIPLQHPRPIAPVSAAIYSNHMAYDHSYSAPTSVAVFSQTPYHRHPGTSDARRNTHEASIPGSLPRYEQQADDKIRDFTIRRSDTSPAKYGADSTSSSMAPRRRSPAKDDSSAVRFDLTEEQEERDRSERRLKRKQDKERREAREQEQIEKDRRASREESIQQRGSKIKQEKGHERSGSSWAGPAAAGLVGAAIGSAAAAERSRSEERREERRERRRRERELEDEKDALNKRERRRRQRERDDQEAIIKEHGRLPDEISASSEYVDNKGRSVKRHDMSVWQEAASTKRSSSHENYGAFFTPLELLNRSSDQAKTTSANADADIDLDQVPQIVTVEPKRIHDLSDSPAFSFVDIDNKVDPSPSSFPWQIPRLRLVEPTPPSTRGSTPILPPKDAGDEGFEEPRKDVSPSKVKWADDQNREYTIIAPKEDCDESIEPPSGKTSFTDPLDLSSSTHLPNDKTPPHRDLTMESSSASYGEDVEFMATLAASAEDAGFDPSIVINNPTYRRRDFPPGSNERSMPGAFFDENEPRSTKKERKRKEKTSRHQSLTDSPSGRDDDRIVQEIISQVEESESQPSDHAPSEHCDDECKSTKIIEPTQSHKGWKGSASGDKFFETPELASEAFKLENCDVYESPTEEVRSSVSIRNEAESGRKSREEEERDSTGFDDAASMEIAPSATQVSKDPEPKAQVQRKGSIWDQVLGKSADSHLQKDLAKVVTEESIVEGYEEPDKMGRMSKVRESSGAWDNNHDSKERNSVEGTTPQVLDMFSQELPVKGQEISLPSAFSDTGSVPKHLDNGVELEQIEEEQPESFLEMRPEPPPPPDTCAGSEELSAPLKTTSLPTSPRAESETKSRRFPDDEFSDPTLTTTAPPSSPTAVPFDLRRRGRSSSTARSLSQTPLSSSQSTADIIQKQKTRPRSAGFESSKGIRPLLPVERHMSPQKPTHDEIYPSLPTSHTTSTSSSVHDPEEREHHQKGSNQVEEGEHEPDEFEPAPLIFTDNYSRQPDPLDSQQATHTASPLQDPTTVVDSPQPCRDSSPKVAVEENPQHSSPTPKSGTLGAILGGSAAVALNQSTEQNDSLRQDLAREKDEDSERALDDIVLDTVTYPSYDDNLDHEADFFPPKAKKGKKKKQKAGQSRQGEGQPSLAGATEAKPSTETVDPELLSPEAMRQVQEQDAQDAVDSWSPSVRSSTKGKKGRKGKGKALVEKLPEESGPAPTSHEPSDNNLETIVSAEGQESNSLIREMSREQVVDIMTNAEQDAKTVENEASQSATVLLEEPVEMQAEENRIEPKGERDTKDVNELPQEDLQQDDLPQEILQETTLSSDGISPDGLQTNTPSPQNNPQANTARDDFPQDNLQHRENPQLEIQERIHPQDDSAQVNLPRDDFLQSQELQAFSLQGDPQPVSLPVLSSSSAPAKTNFVEPYIDNGHGSLLESPKAHPASQDSFRGDLITAISPQLELSPRAIPLPNGDDEHDLLDERLGTPTFTSSGRHDDEEKGTTIESRIDVSPIQDQSATTPEPKGQSQAIPSQANTVDAGKHLAAPPKRKSKKGKKAKQSFSVEDNETAEIQEDDGLSHNVITSPSLEQDWLKGLTKEPGIEVPEAKFETMEDELLRFAKSKNDKIEKATEQSSSVENSGATEMHEGQALLPHIAASGVLEDHEAMNLIDESAVDVAQPKTESHEDEWTGLHDKEKSKEGEKVKPLLSRPKTKTTETEEESGLLPRPDVSQEPECHEARDLIGDPAMHVPSSKPVEEGPTDLIDELASQAPKPKMREDEWARSDSKAGKQAEKQGSKTLDLEPGAEEREHHSERQLDATDEVDNPPSSLATMRTFQETNGRPGFSETEASVGDESKEAYQRVPQAEFNLQKPSGCQISGRDERNLPVLFEPEPPQFEYASGKAHDDERFPTQDTSVASTDAAQVVQDLLAGGNNAESATDAKSEAMTIPTGMKEATVDTPTKEDEIEWDAPKRRKKGKKGKKNEAYSWDGPETIQPAEVSGPPSTVDTPLEQEPAAGRPTEEDELDRDAPKRKKGKKVKKSEAFALDEPKVMESGESSGPSAAMETTSPKQETLAKANDEVLSKQSKKDKKAKKGRRKGASRAISDFRDEDEPNVVPTEDPQDEDNVEDLPAIASGVQGDIKASLIPTQHLQDDNKFEEELCTITHDSRNEVKPNAVASEVLHHNDQLEDRSAVDHPSVTSDVREVVESGLVLTEAPPGHDNVEDLPVDTMPPIGAEIGAPRELFNSTVPIDLAQNDSNENSQDAPLEQEEHVVQPKGKKEKKKSKKSKKSTAFSLNDDESLTLGDEQIAGTKALAKDEPERRIAPSVDVIEQSEKTVPKIRLGQEEASTLPTKTKSKKKSKKFNAFALDKEDLPTLDKLEDEPTSKTKDLEEEVSEKTCPPNVGKEPGTNVEGFPEEKIDRDQVEEAQPPKWKSEDVTARSEPEPAQGPNKDPRTDNIINTMYVSGDLGMMESKREQSMPGNSESISAHAALPEFLNATASSVASSLEQPAGASEETLANHTNESKGNIVPAVDTDMDPPFSLKPSKKTRKTAKKAKKARPLIWEEDEVSQEPGIIVNESSATDEAGKPPIIPIPQYSQPWSKPETSAQEVDSTEVVRSSIRSKEDQGQQGNVWGETLSQARNNIENPVPKLEEDRSPADGTEAAGVMATSPLQGNEQMSEEQVRNDMNNAAAVLSVHEKPVVGLEKEQVPILAEPGVIDEATDEGLPQHVPVQMAENPASKQDEAQRDEPNIEELSSSVAPGSAQETVETVGKQENVADLEPLGSLSKDRPIPTIEVEMLDAQEQREYDEKYARELERAVPSAGPLVDVEPLGSLEKDKRIPAMEDEMLDAQDQRDYNEEDAKEHERTVPNVGPDADLEPLGGPDIDINKPIPAVEVEMLDAQEQRDYNEEYAKELERQLSPLQEGERADSSRDEANTPILSHSSIHSVIEGPYEDHRPLARPPALEDIIEESRSRPSSVQGSPVDREDEFSPFKSTKKGKKGKKGKKKQPIIWEDETATTLLEPGNDQGSKPSITPPEGPGSWITETARPLDLEEMGHLQSSEDRTIVSPTGDLNTAHKRSADTVNDRSDDYFAIEPSRPAEEDVGGEDTQEFRRALATELPYTSNDQFPAQETQADREGFTRDDAFKTYNQDEGLAPLAADSHVKSRTKLEPAVENIENDFGPAPIEDAGKGTKPEEKASAMEPNLQGQGHEGVMDKPQDLQDPTVDTLNEGSPSPQYALQPPLHEDELSSITEGKSTSRGKSGNIEGLAAAVGLGVGALAAGESLTRRDSEKESETGKKAKEVGSWTDFKAGTGEPENASSSLDREELATREQEHRRTPESERAWQHHQATASRSPPPANHKAVAAHVTAGNLGQSSETPKYRDSAIYVCDSPMIPEEIPYHRAVRDSGFPDTEASPTFDDKVEDLDASTEWERGITAGEDVEHVQPQHSRAQETERQESASRNPLEISVEANSDYDVSISRPREGRKHSRRRSGVAYDSDDSGDSGFDIQRRRRRQAMAAEPRVPSPVSSATKERSSVLFDSSPSAREEIAAKPQDRDLAPLYDPVGGKPTWSFKREGSPKEVSKEGKSDHVSGDAPELTGYSISGDQREATGTSLFGGPQSRDDDLRSPSRSPRSSEGRGRRRLNPISEDSSDESALHKKDKRALSDVGSPESGDNGRRTRSPAVGGSVPGEYVSTHDPISHHCWPATEEEKGVIDERSRSRNSDQLSTLSSRHSGRAAVTPSGHGHEEHRTASAGSMRSEKSNIIHAIIRTPDPVRSASGMSYRSTGTGTSTPPLRRVDRSASGDLRGASKKHEAKSHAKKASEFDAELDNNLNAIPSSSTYDPVTDKGKSRADMTDVYEGWGDVRGQSPISPTRPPSMRKRQSMHLLDLEARLDQLVSENRLLASQKLTAEKALQEQARDHSQERHAYQDAMQERQMYLTQKDSEVSELKRIIEQLHDQAAHLAEVNEGLASSRGLDEEHEQRYNQLQTEHAHTHEQWQQSRRELEDLKEQHTQLSTGMEDIVRHEVTVALEEKNIELRRLQSELEHAKQQVRNLQQQLLASRSSDDFVERDEDYFDSRCQSLCQHVQQWVLRFSKFSDMKACYLAREIQDEKVVDRMENAILDGSDVDDYLSDRVKRRDVFMSVVMTMIWEFIFTRYLFGMDREQRQKLKSLEKTLQGVGPISAVHKWRATTLTLLMKREAFENQRVTDTEAVVHEIYDTLATFLPPPSHLVDQIQDSLRKVIDAAVDLSIEMRTQRAEYSMLPPLQPEYDTNGDLARKVYFSALTMNERSGATSSNEALQEQQAVVRMVLFPLVVKNEDDDEQIVVCPAQVLTAEGSKGKKTVRVLSAQGGRSEASFAGSDVRTEGGMI